MATENNSNNKETSDENLTTSAETKAMETEKSGTPPSSATDKLNDAAKSAGAIAGSVFTKAKGLADSAVKTATSDATKQNLNDAAKTAGAIAGKVFAKAKDAAADVKRELGNVNDLRKETFSNSEAATSKKDMAKGFWLKLSGKQKGILAGIAAVFMYLSYSVLFSADHQGSTNSGYKVQGVALGRGSVPCSPKESTYVDFMQVPKRFQMECRIDTDGGWTDLFFSSDGKSVVRVTRRQYIKLLDDTTKNIVEAAIKNYGKPDYLDSENFLANYGNAYAVTRTGARADVKLNDSGQGLLIHAIMCAAAKAALSKRCVDERAGIFEITYDLIDVVKWKEQFAEGEAKMAKTTKEKISGAKY